VVPLVRIPPNSRERNQWIIKQALDTGVYGLVLPHLNTVDEAQAAVVAARYPQVSGAADFEPVEQRGWWQRIAPRYWGLTAQEYYDAADLWPLDPNGNILLMGIIEEPEGVSNLRDILRQVRGIGVFGLGRVICRLLWDCGEMPAIRTSRQICSGFWKPVRSSVSPVALEPTRRSRWRCGWIKGFGSSLPHQTNLRRA